MAEPTQFTFSIAEAAEALIKKQGIHEGKWILAIEFNVSIGVIGSGPTEARPGAMMLANTIQLMKAPDPATAPPHLIVDAAIVNPS